MNKRYLGLAILFIISISIIVFNAYSSNYDYSHRKRAEIAGQNNEDIHIAVVWDLLHEKSFLDGVKLAFKEINAQGIALKSDNKSTIARLVLHEFDDGTEEDAKDSWLSIADNHEIVAVIGHSSSASAIPASISYEYNGILFISAIATHPALTNHNFKYTFSIIPSDKYFVDKLLEYLRENNLFKLIILYARDDYGINFYQEFVSQFDDSFEIVASRSFYPIQEDIVAGNMTSNKDMIYQIMQNDFDAVILIARDKLGAEMIGQLRSMGVTQPIIGGEGLDNQQIWNMPYQTSNNTYVTTVIAENDKDAQNPLTNTILINNFTKNFTDAYGYSPGYLAFQGYDAAMILASAYRMTGSTVPIRVASTLKFHYRHGYKNYVFNLNGMVSNKKIYIKEMVNGKSKMVGLESLQ